jgi:N-acetyl-anhydromuramyl-L-alanine amidase AmpD
MQIQNLIASLPTHPGQVWGKRKLSQVQKIIIHQELGESSIEEVNHYHITPAENNHISKAGCPHFCYHFGIRKNGEVVLANEYTDITWHCSGQNTTSIGIMVQGNFAGPGHDLGNSEPTPKQIESLGELTDYLLKTFKLKEQDVWGHYHFGKRACPGYVLQDWIEKKRNALPKDSPAEKIEKTVTEIQKRLALLGYNPGTVDGIMGIKTQSAIRNFQADNQLLVDGIAGPQTWKKLLKLTFNN